MPSPRKIFIHNTCHFITTRMEEGLPLVPRPFMNRILKGTLVRASKGNSVKVCAFCFMANHLHMIIVVDFPGDVPRFVQILKQEIAHAVNRLLGREKRTVWEEGYDSPILLDPARVMQTLEYIYTNPQSANLVEKIEDFPGLTSWGMIEPGHQSFSEKIVPRTYYPPLPEELSHTDEVNLERRIFRQALPRETFTLHPFAWLECFEETANTSPEVHLKNLKERVREKERSLTQERANSGTSVVGRRNLKKLVPTFHHRPKSGGRRSTCLASTHSSAKAFLAAFRYGVELCKQAFQRSYDGLPIAHWPAGFFPPGGRASWFCFSLHQFMHG